MDTYPIGKARPKRACKRLELLLRIHVFANLPGVFPYSLTPLLVSEPIPFRTENRQGVRLTFELELPENSGVDIINQPTVSFRVGEQAVGIAVQDI